MKILHSVRGALLKWKHIPSTVGSCVGQRETTHRKCLGDVRNLSIYGKCEMSSISRVVSRTHRSLFERSDQLLSNCMYMVNRSSYIQHGVMVTETGREDTDVDSQTAREKMIREKIETRIKEVIKNVLEKTEESEKKGDLKIVLAECVRHLCNLRLNPAQIDYFVAEHKDIYKHAAFVPITQFFYRNGLNGRRTVKLVVKYPKVLDITKDVMRDKIQHLRDLGFISADILLIIEGLPEVLELPVKKISRRISELQLLFKSKDVLDLLSKSPSILTQDLAVISEKFDYVFHVMGISQRQIMYSCLFKHSINHIRQRHVFLVRAGFYQKRLKKGQINPNPILEDIVDISTRAFLKKYGNMTMSDYVAFCELFERETRDIQHEVGGDSDEEMHEWNR